MPDFSKGKIYKITNLTSDDPCDCYVGSTCDLLCRRWAVHKAFWKRNDYPNRLLYQQFSEVGIDNFRIVLIENYPCNDINELKAREEFHRSQINAKYNSIRAFVTEEDIQAQKKQYYEKNKHITCEKAKEYRKLNKDKIAVRHKNYYEANKETLLQRNHEYHEQHKEQIREQQKEYYQLNREKRLAQSNERYQQHKMHIIQQHKEYRQNNKEIIKAKRSVSYNCECGGKYRQGDKAKHFKTQIHLDLLQKNQTE